MSELTEMLDLAAEIKHYLDHQPKAMDTLEGVAKWWVTQQRIDVLLTDVKQAMDYLLQQGVIEVKELPGGELVYQRRIPRQQHQT